MEWRRKFAEEYSGVRPYLVLDTFVISNPWKTCRPAFYFRAFFAGSKRLTPNSLNISNLAILPTAHTAPLLTFLVRFSTGSWTVRTVKLRSRENILEIVERETGIEPSTPGLGSRCSTIELLPLACSNDNTTAHVILAARHQRSSERGPNSRIEGPIVTATALVLLDQISNLL